MDGDGDEDFILGNIGGNNKFHPSNEKPLHIYAKDFDNNGSFDVAMSKVNKGKLVPVRGKQCSSEQNPFLLDKIGSFKEFATNDMAGIYGEEELASSLHLKTTVMESMYLENLGNGKFDLQKLPNSAQMGPTMGSVLIDVNGDGTKELIGAGAIYDAEVETIRYDSNFGYALSKTSDGWVPSNQGVQPYFKGDYKDIKAITIAGKPHILGVANNSELTVLRLSAGK